MKFTTSLFAAALLLGASAAYAGSDDGNVDSPRAAKPTTSQPTPAAAHDAQTADVYSQFEHQIAQP